MVCVDAGSGTIAISPSSWISIVGPALAAKMRAWSAADVVNGSLPSYLRVRVEIDKKFATVAFISPTQIHALAARGGRQRTVHIENV
jgi:uncharacterized protein (TIGR03437 family)